MSPQVRLICAQGQDSYIYIQICIKQQVQETGHVSLPLMSTASLRVVGHECHKPLQQNEVLHLYRWYTHTDAPRRG